MRINYVTLHNNTTNTNSTTTNNIIIIINIMQGDRINSHTKTQKHTYMPDCRACSPGGPEFEDMEGVCVCLCVWCVCDCVCGWVGGWCVVARVKIVGGLLEKNK